MIPGAIPRVDDGPDEQECRRPSAVGIVSSHKITPLMNSPSPGVVTISSRSAPGSPGSEESPPSESLVAGSNALVDGEQALIARDQRLRRACNLVPHFTSLLCVASSLKRLEARDDIEELLVDTALAHAMELPWRFSSDSLMFFSARSIAARRLAFSLASDSALARKSETKNIRARTRAASPCLRP